jgi:glutathione synthase/RimK-type ligase-like ATP-grasp enzyme
VRFLLTSSRLPFALEAIRKLGRSGHTVYASDTFRSAPGSHSKHVAEAFVTAAPGFDAAGFLDDLEAIVRSVAIDLVIPAFEEVFYIARHRERIERYARVFAPSFDTLGTLHDKLRFHALARELGLPVLPTLVARDRAELGRAIGQYARFFARPAYTRGGVTLFTNAGPLAGSSTLDDHTPTAANPWIVSPFVDGIDVCSYSIAHGGRVSAHATYHHPLMLEHAGGIVFESVVSDDTLRVAQQVAEATRYDGQLSLDFLRTDGNLYVIECNPRPCAGLVVMPDAMFDAGLRDASPELTLVAPAGVRRKLSLALIRNALVHRREAAENLAALLRPDPDIYADPRDLVPLLWQLVAYSRVLRYRLHRGRVERSDLMQGYFHDICWDGAEMG